MRRRNAQVEQEAIDPGHLGRAKQLVQVAEVALQQLVRYAGNLAVQTGASGLEGHVVLIDAEQKAGLPHLRGHLYRMAGTAKGAVADDGTAL